MNTLNKLLIGIILTSVFAAGAWAQNLPSTNKDTPEPLPIETPHLSVCYNKEFPPIAFAPFSIITVDPSYPSISLDILRKSSKNALCHLSLGKVNSEQGWFKPLQAAGALKTTTDAKVHNIDLNNPAWETLLIQALIPQLIKKGFNGLFLDDLDLLAKQGQQGQVTALIGNIRKSFPQLKLLVKGGLKFLPAFAPQIDFFVMENRIAKHQKLAPISQVSIALELLAKGKSANPKLIAFALDYFSPNPTELNTENLIFIANLRRLHWEYALNSCVTVESLDAVPIRPLD